MMREILFRGKRIGSEAWIYGDLRDWRTGCIGIRNNGLSKAVTVFPETVGQYTGFNDGTLWDDLTKEEKSFHIKASKGKLWSGRRIFEGDIVDYDSKKLVVSFEKGCWVIWDKKEFWRFLQANAKYCKVIGNIHDNPELLEVSGDE